MTLNLQREDLEKEIEVLMARFRTLHINGNGKKLNGDSKKLLKQINELKSLQREMET